MRRRSGGGSSWKRIRCILDSCEQTHSTVDEIVQYLQTQHRDYERTRKGILARVVQQALQFSSKYTPKPSPSASELTSDADNDEREHAISASSSVSISFPPKKRRKTNGTELMRRNQRHEEVVGAVSTSEDSIYGEEEPRIDLMKLTLRRGYNQSNNTKPELEEKNIEMEVATNKKTKDGIDMTNQGGAAKKDAKASVTAADGTTMEVNGKDGTRLRDFGGMGGVLLELRKKVLLPLYYPQLPRMLGLRPMTGILLHGPPGCGKTKLAHAVANETGVPFYKISATEVVSGVLGESEEKIRELFSKAYRTAPSIVFIDEIDAIGSKRENSQRGMECRIVTQLMTCMDESHRPDSKPGFVVVIGATNRPDAIDPALRRRFHREIALGVPDENARHEILSVLTRKLPRLEGSVDLWKIARATAGFVGADLDALVNEAKTLAMERFIEQTVPDFFKESIDDEPADWWRPPPFTEGIENVSVTMADLEEAVKMVQPSSKREGFSTIPDVKWEDVGGLDDLRQEFDRYIVRRIKYPEIYAEFGVNLEIGILLYGPPGCGKTLIAKAVANEAGANFIYIKGPELFGKYVGESEKSVRTLFSRARTCSPCILFFDEVDALTTERGNQGVGVAERLLDQLLIELDGADQRRGVYVIGATNRPDTMDRALLRPGRFGKLLYVPLPTPDERGLILKALARKKPVDSSVELSGIGRMEACENFSGADLSALVTEAAMTAMEEKYPSTGKTEVSGTIKTLHFERALSKISPSVSVKQKLY